MGDARSRFLLPGCARPDDAVLEAFWIRASAVDATLEDVDFAVRWIGADADSTDRILTHVISGAKTGTVSLPDVLAHRGEHAPDIGDGMVLIRCDGTPAVAVRITAIDVVRYADIDESHTALDGPNVRALDVWLPLHRPYFDLLLRPLGRTTGDDTLIRFETFELVYSEFVAQSGARKT